MPYDALGNYVPGDEPTYTQQKPARGRIPDPAYMQIPTPNPAYGNVPNVDEMRMALSAMKAANFKDPLAKTHKRFAELQADIASLPQQISDVTNTLIGNPMQMMVRTPIEAMLKRQTSVPELNALLEKNMAPMQTPQGEAFASNVGKAFEASKLPPWPMRAGVVESVVGMPQRPMFEPSDLRALSGDAARLATQIGDVVPDFQAAQTGFKRVDPVTGKPTVGAKAQALMDDWANVLQRRQEVTGTPTFGGIAPETNMYAVRPDKGTRVIQPTRTEDTSTHPFYVDPLTNIVSEVASVAELDNKRLLNRYTDLDSHRLPSQRGAALPVTVKRQINNYITGRLQEIYPDVPIRSGEGGDDALHAAFQIGNKPTIRDQKMLGMYEDFFKTDEGKAAIAQSGGTLVPPSVHAERHAAASNWLNSTFKNYLDTRIGTTADPLLQKAKQGVTYKPASELEGYAESVYDTARLNRTAGGFPQTSVFMPEFRALGDKLDVVNAEVNALEARKAELTATLPPESEMQGRSFNDVIPGYNDFMREYDAKIAERTKLHKDMANLRIAQDYETLADAAVQPRVVSKVLNELPPQEIPFYPSLTKAPPESIAYNLKKGTLGALGIDDMVSSFYNDVLTGKVPVEKLKGLTVDKYVQQHFDKRRLREIEEEKAAQTYLTNVNTALQERVQQVPNDNIFYNAAVIEFDANTPKEQAYKDLSADTTILDICVAECGGADPKKKHFITGKPQTHEAMYDITTGERNPNSNLSRDYSTYTDEIYNGTKLASIRDSTTGYPAATIRMSPASMPGQYNINWVKGYKNGAIAREYSEGIAAYLNSRENVIASSGSELQTNAGVFDTQTPAGMRALSQRVPGMDPEEVRYLDFDFVELPRFVTQNQFNEIVAGAVDGTPSATALAPAQQSRFAVESTADMRRRLTAEQLDEANELHTHISDQLEQVVYDAIEQNNSPLSAQRDFLQLFRDDPTYYAGEIDPAIVEYAIRFIEEQNPDIAPQDTQTALNNLEYTPSRALAQQQQEARPVGELYEMFIDVVENSIEEGSFDPNDYSAMELAEHIRNDEVGGEIGNLTPQEREILANAVESEGYNPGAYFPPEQLAPPPAEVQLPPEDLGLFEPDPTHPANRPVASTQAPTAELYTQELTRLNARYDALTADVAEWNRQMLPYIRRENDGTITPEQLRDLESLRDQYDDTVRELQNTQQQIGETARQQQAAFEMQQTPQRNAVTPDISNLSDAELSQRLSIEQSTQVQNVFAQIVRSARDSDIALTPELIDSVSNWSFNARALAPEQKEFLKRLLTRHIQRERGVGFAKGGTVRIAKTIPAMRAELRRT